MSLISTNGRSIVAKSHWVARSAREPLALVSLRMPLFLLSFSSSLCFALLFFSLCSDALSSTLLLLSFLLLLFWELTLVLFQCSKELQKAFALLKPKQVSLSRLSSRRFKLHDAHRLTAVQMLTEEKEGVEDSFFKEVAIMQCVDSLVRSLKHRWLTVSMN